MKCLSPQERPLVFLRLQPFEILYHSRVIKQPSCANILDLLGNGHPAPLSGFVRCLMIRLSKGPAGGTGRHLSTESQNEACGFLARRRSRERSAVASDNLAAHSPLSSTKIVDCCAPDTLGGRDRARHQSVRPIMPGQEIRGYPPPLTQDATIDDFCAWKGPKTDNYITGIPDAPRIAMRSLRQRPT